MAERPQASRAALSPNRAVALGRRLFGPFLMRSGITSVLEVPGRRSGRPIRVTLVAWEVDGNRYLMSQYGITEWVRNLRAAGRGTLRRKGAVQVFRAVEVEGDERDRVIAAFRARADRLLNADFDRLPSAGDHPTFRIDAA